MLGEGIQQLYVFLAFWALGVILTVLYLFVVGLLKGRVLTLLFDVCYGVFAVYSVWKLNLQCNNGNFRFFVFVALLLGAIIVSLTCKTTLDKLSCALYNLFTSKKVGKEDERTVLQKEHIDIVGSGGSSADTATVHSAHVSDATLQHKAGKGRIRRTFKRGKSKRRSQAGIVELSQHR